MDQILLVDSEVDGRDPISRMLTGAGFGVTWTATGAAGLAAARSVPFDLVILELGLPDVAGEVVLQKLRSHPPQVPVLILSTAPVSQRAAALTLGAADCLAKPADGAELLARVRLRIRDARLVSIGDWAQDLAPGEMTRHRFDPQLRILIVNGRRISLSNREYLLLQFLLQRQGTVCSREEILRHAWHNPIDTGSNIVDVFIRRVRAKNTGYTIETVRNGGYRLVA